MAKKLMKFCTGCRAVVPVVLDEMTQTFSCKAHRNDVTHVIGDEEEFAARKAAQDALPKGICFYHGWVRVDAGWYALKDDEGRPIEVCGVCGHALKAMDRDV